MTKCGLCGGALRVERRVKVTTLPAGYPPPCTILYLQCKNCRAQFLDKIDHKEKPDEHPRQRGRQSTGRDRQRGR